MQAIRHDFRHYYHVAYEDVPLDEAVDLLLELGPGTRYRAALSPMDAWSVDRELLAQAVDKLDLRLLQASGNLDKHVRVTRPIDAYLRKQEAARRESVRNTIKNTKWVDQPTEEPSGGES